MRRVLAGRRGANARRVFIGVLALALASCGAAPRVSTSGAPASSFAVLSSAPSGDDALPTDVVASLSRNVEREFSRADIRAARRVLANKPAWLIPAANGEMCLVARVYAPASRGPVLPPTLTTDCAPEEAANSGEIVETQSVDNNTQTVRLVGVVGDGVGTVAVVTRHGPPVVIDVIRNGYEALVRKPIAVTFLMRHGQHVTKHSIPVAVPPSKLGQPARKGT